MAYSKSRLAVAFGVRLPRELSSGFAKRAMATGRGSRSRWRNAGIATPHVNSILKAIVAINADMKRLERSSAVCRRLMTIPGVGRLPSLETVRISV